MTSVDIYPENIQKFIDALAGESMERGVRRGEREPSGRASTPDFRGDFPQAFLRFARSQRKGVELHSTVLIKTAEHIENITE